MHSGKMLNAIVLAYIIYDSIPVLHQLLDHDEDWDSEDSICMMEQLLAEHGGLN